MLDRVLIVFPPVTAARFFPYLSLPQLTGHLLDLGVEALQSDLNIELAHYLTEPQVLRQFAEKNIHPISPHKWSPHFKEFLAFKKSAPYLRQRIFVDRPKTVDEKSIAAHHMLGRLIDIQLAYYGYLKPFSCYQDIETRARRTLGHMNDPVQAWLSARMEGLIDKFDPTLIMLSVAFGSQLLLGLYLTDLVKREHAHILTSMGGPFFQAHRSYFSTERSFLGTIDRVSIGSGELFLGEFLREGRDRKHTQSTKNFGIADIRRSVLPNWSGLPVNAYLNPGFHLGLTSCHGCWWGRCIFCSYGNQSLHSETSYRGKTRAQLLDEISYVIQTLAPQQINITDEESNLPTLVSVFRVLHERGTEITWNVRYRLGLRLRESDYCQQMADLGCRILFAGFESTSQRVLDRLDRGILAKDYDRVLDNLSGAGVRPRISLCLGFPGETRAEAEDTCRFVIDNFGRLELDNLQQMVAEPSSLSGSRSDDYGLELLRDDQLMSNPSTSYAGGRYGINMAEPPEVLDLLEQVSEAWKHFSHQKFRAQRQKWIDTNPDWRQLAAAVSLGSGDVTYLNADEAILTNYRLAKEVEISRSLGESLENNDDRRSIESLSNRLGQKDTSTSEWVRDLFIEGFIELEKPVSFDKRA